MWKHLPGTVARLKAVRLSELGAFLDGGTGNTKDDILLHKSQQTGEVKAGDEVEVFLYLDPKRRLTASMRIPKMHEGQIARVKVIGVTKDGAFLDAGAERGIFLPFAGMIGRPQVGETVWAKLYTDKSGRLAMTMDVADEIRRASRKATADSVHVGSRLTGTVYNVTGDGAFVLTAERYIMFIPTEEMTALPRPGAEVTGRVTYVRDDGRLNGSLRETKEKAMLTDAEVILTELAKGGKMPYSDSTAPEIIREKFHISKAAFKRALGHLLKEGRIEKKDGWTILKINE